MIQYYKIATINESLVFNSKYEPSEIIRLNYKDIFEIEMKRTKIILFDGKNKEAIAIINEETNNAYNKHHIPRYLIAYQDTTIHEPNEYFELASHQRLHFDYEVLHGVKYEVAKELYSSFDYKIALCNLFGLYYEELDDQIKGFDEPKVKEEINIDYLTEKLLKLAQNNPEEFKQIMTKILENSQIINNNSENKDNNIKKLLMNISK